MFENEFLVLRPFEIMKADMKSQNHFVYVYDVTDQSDQLALYDNLSELLDDDIQK